MRLTENLTVRIALGWLSLRGNKSVGVENVGFGINFRVMEVMPMMRVSPFFYKISVISCTKY